MKPWRGDIEIGRRAYLEVLRLFPKLKDAVRAIGLTNAQLFYEWGNGINPSAKYLARLHNAGADVIWILTGKRSRPHRRPIEKKVAP